MVLASNKESGRHASSSTLGIEQMIKSLVNPTGLTH
jgi:hypothetical protein